jgi:hypothetical protein
MLRNLLVLYCDYWRQKRGSQFNALGRSRGRFSTKIHVLTEAHGLPIAVHLTPGQTADISAASALLADTEQRPRALLADKGYDSTTCAPSSICRGLTQSSRGDPAASSPARWTGFDTPSATASGA